jgi:hypothetical protein
MPDGRRAPIHTGQDRNRLMSDIFLKDLQALASDRMFDAGVAGHVLPVQTARVMEGIEPLLEGERPHLAIVPVDANSALAATPWPSSSAFRSPARRRACSASTARCPRTSSASSPTIVRASLAALRRGHQGRLIRKSYRYRIALGRIMPLPTFFIIGAGAVVISDVPPGARAVGNPAQIVDSEA